LVPLLKEAPVRVAIYARISKDRSGISQNVDTQVRECREYARAQGWGIAGIFSDNDISASKYSKKPRPGYQTLLTAIRHDGIEAIVVTEMPRLYRRLEELLEVIKLAERTSLNHIITLDEAGYDLSTGQGIHNAISAVNNAMLESRRSSDRQKRRIRAQAQKGMAHGGYRPFGYEQGGMVIKDDEADAVRWMTREIIRGMGLNDVARGLNARGIPTVTGKAWDRKLVRRVLSRKRLAGIREHQGTEYPAAWSAIITLEEWELVQFAIHRRGRQFPGGAQAGRTYLLTGLLFCGRCEGPMYGHQHRRDNAPPHPRYRCSRCGRVFRIAEPLDKFVSEAVLYRLDTEGVARLLAESTSTDVRPLLARYQALQARGRELIDDYARGILDRSEFMRAKAINDEAIEAVQEQLAEAQPTQVLRLPAGETIRQAWEKGSLTWRRTLIGLLVERVIVKPGQSGQKRWRLPGTGEWVFDPDLIKIVWRV
jgi:site-specific DNA recombinase